MWQMLLHVGVQANVTQRVTPPLPALIPFRATASNHHSAIYTPPFPHPTKPHRPSLQHPSLSNLSTQQLNSLLNYSTVDRLPATLRSIDGRRVPVRRPGARAAPNVVVGSAEATGGAHQAQGDAPPGIPWPGRGVGVRAARARDEGFQVLARAARHLRHHWRSSPVGRVWRLPYLNFEQKIIYTYASIQRLRCPSIANRKGCIVVHSFLWANAASGLMGRDSQPPTKR